MSSQLKVASHFIILILNFLLAFLSRIIIFRDLLAFQTPKLSIFELFTHAINIHRRTVMKMWRNHFSSFFLSIVKLFFNTF